MAKIQDIMTRGVAVIQLDETPQIAAQQSMPSSAALRRI